MNVFEQYILYKKSCGSFEGFPADLNDDDAFDVFESIRTTSNAAPLESLQIDL